MDNGLGGDVPSASATALGVAYDRTGQILSLDGESLAVQLAESKRVPGRARFSIGACRRVGRWIAMSEHKQSYRPGVGLFLLGRTDHLFIVQRKDFVSDAWQMPQGGIELETHHRAFVRWRPAAPQELPELVASFKRQLYLDVLQEFSEPFKTSR